MWIRLCDWRGEFPPPASQNRFPDGRPVCRSAQCAPMCPVLARSSMNQTRKEHYMSNDSNRHVTPNPDGGWDVQKPGGSRASSHHETQADAIGRAREIVGNAGGGEVRIHGRDGQIRDSDTVAPGNDPNPPRDRK